MIVEAGAFVRAAKSHENEGRGCEDAACAFGLAQGGFAVLSDGCSGGEESGLAAKVLAHAAAKAVHQAPPESRESPDFESWARQAQKAACAALELCGLAGSNSPGTLMLAWVDALSGHASWSCWGDGVVAVARGGKLVGAWEGVSMQNMPAYPLYAFDEDLWARFEACGGAFSWRPMLGASSEVMTMELSERCWVGRAQLQEGDLLMLVSDGALAVEGVEPLDVLTALALAKGPGRFMERRAARAIEGWIKSGANLGDDLGVAALRLG